MFVPYSRLYLLEHVEAPSDFFHVESVNRWSYEGPLCRHTMALLGFK